MSSELKEDEAKQDPREAVDRSCRGPVLFLAFSAVAWLLVYSFFALLAGGALLGFTGVLLAVPMAAIIGVLLRFGLKRYRASSLYSGVT